MMNNVEGNCGMTAKFFKLSHCYMAGKTFKLPERMNGEKTGYFKDLKVVSK